ncbi:MAG: zinc ribbon domain-containing protein [Candidatus Thermoplasmatota archaeon]|nr:zinc ribbon domain-containing protein [Candidatus Thermoplasmatota archaeon]
MAARRGISQGLLVTPVIIGLGLDATVTPLNAMLDVSAWLRWAYYGSLFLIGFVLFRRARVERDHEHRRSASLKGLKTVFKAEEQGLWERNDAAPTGGPISVESGAKVGGLTREGSEVNIETEVDVETIHGMRIQASDDVHRTVGATGKASSMDTVLDALGRVFRRGDDLAGSRHQRRKATLQQRAEGDPLIAARPVAPMAMEAGDLAETTTSLQAMATPPPPPVHACGVCGAQHEPEDRFCPACGSKLPQVQA